MSPDSRPSLVASPEYFEILAAVMREVGVTAVHFQEFGDFLNGLKWNIDYHDRPDLLERLIREELRIMTDVKTVAREGA